MRALQATLAVVFITLALFFASGMYEEKIRYAHSCVPVLPSLFLHLILPQACCALTLLFIVRCRSI